MTSEKPLLFTSVSSSRKKCYSGFACYSHLPDSTLIFRLFELDDFCFSSFQKCFLTWSFQFTDNLPLPTNVSWVVLHWLCHQSLFLSAQHLQERQCEWLALTLISPLFLFNVTGILAQHCALPRWPLFPRLISRLAGDAPRFARFSASNASSDGLRSRSALSHFLSFSKCSINSPCLKKGLSELLPSHFQISETTHTTRLTLIYFLFRSVKPASGWLFTDQHYSLTIMPSFPSFSLYLSCH